ncbi:MAG: DNA-directed RNA polymerase subunit beta [Candidatus Brocadiae bacterium]|nr:DNA-directed RNA polymerase subunit beta [Candidatus Brocadiia bacterium]
MEIRTFGKVSDAAPIPNLVDIQTKAYDRFLQADLAPNKREKAGLEALIQEIFPIPSYDGSIELQYLGYELRPPRYTPDECRRLRLTYGAPLKVRLRLQKAEPIEEDVYLGEIPLMIGGGEFIINGAERVIVSQLHRSPGIDFTEEKSGDKKLHSCWIVPERGSWIELSVGKKESLYVRIDQSGKIPATTFLRAMSPEYSTNADIIRLFHETKRIKIGKDYEQLKGKVLVDPIVDAETGKILVEAGKELLDGHIKIIERREEIKELDVIPLLDDPALVNTLGEDPTKSHEDALLKIYARLRPGTPQQLDRAKALFNERFFDATRYRLGRVGRFRLNRKFQKEKGPEDQVLMKEDIVNAISYILKMRKGQGVADDIDHLGNRRVRAIDELAAEEIRKGFLRLRRTIGERMNLDAQDQLTPRGLINAKTVSSAIEYFFGRGELSQVVDQTNPLAQLTHERRLSALGPGGLNRKRAGFEVRDVHISHYGRICPIETPEGTNIGLISSLGIYATIDQYGFLICPYRLVKNGRVTDEVKMLRANEEMDKVMAPADLKTDAKGHLIDEKVIARVNGEFCFVPREDVSYMDVSPKQMTGVSAALIPFLEHDDANRALMGSNMQRQAVPLLETDPPLVGTGMEKIVAENSAMVVVSKKAGTVTAVDATRIVVDDHEYMLRKFVGLNERTCLNQKPIVKLGQKVTKGQVIADGAATSQGILALGKNVKVAFMPWDGFNFEDAIIVGESLIKADKYTSIHIEEFEIEIRETKLGREEFTRDIPNVSEKQLKNLGEDGIIRIGTRVKPGDILVGKVAPKSKSELTPEEKLLHVIFGRAGEDVKNDSLEVPSGVEGIVLDAEKFSRKVSLSEKEREEAKKEKKKIEKDFDTRVQELLDALIKEIKPTVGRAVPATLEFGARTTGAKDLRDLRDRLDWERWDFDKPSERTKVSTTIREFFRKAEIAENEKERKTNRLERGDELPTGVLEMVKIYIATKRNLSVGDKMAGRHGNKGVVARIMPDEDMPFLADGTPVEMILNPLGVPSRMNVGQILETHLGWAGSKLGFRSVTPVFEGATEEEITELLGQADLPMDGKSVLHDGRTGEPFDERVTVGMIYMLKLHHLVDDKVHARATGPYSLITQQPLGGKARYGGQRFGEMEVWALEAYGAANILQELLTVKSDDVDGRTKIYESMVKGENTLEPGTPMSFEVLTNEIKGLGLSLKLEKRKGL